MNIQEWFRRITIGACVLWCLYWIWVFIDWRFIPHSNTTVYTTTIFVDVLMCLVWLVVGTIVIWLIYYALSWAVKGFLTGLTMKKVFNVIILILGIYIVFYQNWIGFYLQNGFLPTHNANYFANYISRAIGGLFFPWIAVWVLQRDKNKRLGAYAWTILILHLLILRSLYLQ